MWTSTYCATARLTSDGFVVVVVPVTASGRLARRPGDHGCRLDGGNVIGGDHVVTDSLGGGGDQVDWTGSRTRWDDVAAYLRADDRRLRAPFVVKITGLNRVYWGPRGLSTADLEVRAGGRARQ
jgi:hypothetical protein